MKHLLLQAVTTAFVLVGSAFAQERAARPLLVGVVDVGLAFKSYKRKDDLEKLINDKKDSFEKEAAQQQAELDALTKKAPPETDKEAVAKFRAEVGAAVAKIKARRNEWDSELKADVERFTVMILDEIEHEVAAFGKKNGYALIFKTDSQGWGDERLQERIFRAQSASVVYHAPGLDVTAEIVQELNAAASKKPR